MWFGVRPVHTAFPKLAMTLDRLRSPGAARGHLHAAPAPLPGLKLQVSSVLHPVLVLLLCPQRSARQEALLVPFSFLMVPSMCPFLSLPPARVLSVLQLPPRVTSPSGRKPAQVSPPDTLGLVFI
jgi:hypothetical protein